MTIRISESWRDRAASGTDLIDVGTGTAVLQLRTGSPPANLTDAAAGTLLASFDLPNPAFGAPSNGVATANAISDTTGVADGTVGHFRVLDRDGDPVSDSASVGTTGSGEELEMNTLSISTGVDVAVGSWTVTMPEQV